jgi:hypothetical protein
MQMISDDELTAIAVQAEQGADGDVKAMYDICSHALPSLVAEVRRLREVERIAAETLQHIARCGCKACGPAPRDLAHARTLADDALTRMSVVE